MSAPLPHLEKGDRLRADKLNAITARVRELQARMPTAGGGRDHPMRIIPGRHYAFELGTLNGIIYYRQGWIDPGDGTPQPVGDKEWNPLGSLKPCTVWLEFTGNSPETCTAEVVVSEYDETTPENNLRRRLGYVRQEAAKESGQAPTLYCVQVCGGLMTPIAPRRAMGSSSLVEPGQFCKYDHSYAARYAGALYGEGHEVENADDIIKARVSWGYSMGMYTDFSAPHGHKQAAQCLSFYTTW